MTADDAITNHFEVRWVDGYGAVSDATSELAVAIEELAAGLPSSQDEIQLAVGDVRRPDNLVERIGLLRLDVAVAAEQRVQGFLHAAVIPPGYRLELDDWRALVEQRYGPEPEERIRELYQELATTKRGGGRSRLRSLEIRPEDVSAVLMPYEGSRGRGSRRPGSMPSISQESRPARPPTNPASRSSQPTIAAPRDPAAPLPPADGPALGGGARPADETGGWFSRQRSPRRVRLLLMLSAGTVAVAVAVAVWSMARNGRLTFERDQLAGELASARTATGAMEDGLRRELASLHAELATARKRIDALSRTEDPALQSCNATLAELRGTLAEARTKLAGSENRAASLEQERRVAVEELATTKRGKDAAEQQLQSATQDRKRTETEREQQREQARRLAADLARRESQLKGACDALRAVRGGKLPAECQGIK